MGLYTGLVQTQEVPSRGPAFIRLTNQVTLRTLQGQNVLGSSALQDSFLLNGAELGRGPHRLKVKYLTLSTPTPTGGTQQHPSP